MATYSYIDSQGRERTVEAPDATAALAGAQDIARNAGVRLLPSTESSTINLGQIDTTAVPLPNTALQTPIPPVVAPTTFASTPQTQETEEQRLIRERTQLQSDIAALESRISGSAQRRDTALQEANVFDDVRRLNELRAEQRRIEDRAIEIPIEARQQLRGRGATTREFAQTTTPRLESQALEALASSRNVSALTDTINTNIALIDSRLEEERNADLFVLQQRTNQLNTIESAYSSILSDRQKQQLEEQKFLNEVAMGEIEWERSMKSELLKSIAAKGVGGAQLGNLASASLDELFSFDSQLRSPEQVAQQTANETGAMGVVNLINDLLNNNRGLESSVGTFLGSTTYGQALADVGLGFGLLGAGVGAAANQGDANRFRSQMQQLLSKETLENLIAIKNRGATFGALSDTETRILQNAANALGAIFDKNGNFTGRSNFKEEDFKQALETMRIGAMKTFIAERIGQEAFRNAGYQTASQDTVRKAYEGLLGTTPSSQGGSITPLQQDLDPTLSLLRREEGLRTTAYQDTTGTWTIGYGNTMINGRPVRQGDRITEAQAEQMLRDTALNQYSSYQNRITTNLTPNQRAALTSFEYNLGSGVWNTATGQQILAAINRGQVGTAGNLMLQYNKSRNANTGVLELNPVLAARREREASLLFA